MAREEIRVLVVDDEETVRNLLQRILKEVGYDVATAANGQEALAKMAKLKPGVVLLDIRMSGMSGIEVLEQIRTNWPETCVVMATAAADVQTAVEAMTKGAYDYITKPFNQDDLLLKVQRAVEKRDYLWRLLKNLEPPD